MIDIESIDIDRTPATDRQVWRITKDIAAIRDQYGANAAKVSATYRHIDDCFFACGVPISDMSKPEASGIIELIERERRSGEHRRIAATLASTTAT